MTFSSTIARLFPDLFVLAQVGQNIEGKINGCWLIVFSHSLLCVIHIQVVIF